MIQAKETQQWFYAPDFMKYSLGDLFVGYEATARLSDLVREYPFAFATKKEGKYRYVRMKFESIDRIIRELPPDLSQFVRDLFYKDNDKFLPPPPVDKASDICCESYGLFGEHAQTCIHSKQKVNVAKVEPNNPLF